MTPEELRKAASDLELWPGINSDLLNAADEIERLQRRVAELELNMSQSIESREGI